MFSFLQVTPSLNVCTGDMSSSFSTEGIGTVSIICGKQTHTLTDCLYVPKLNCNLISLLRLGHNNVTIHRKENHFSLLSGNQILFEGKIMNNLMKVDCLIAKALITQIPKLWHQRLGHPGDQIIRSMGLLGVNTKCLTCDKNKIHSLPFNDHFEQVSLPLDCFHIDLVGPISPASVSGSRYLLTIVDQATSYKIIRLLKNKSDAFHQFVLAKKAMENQHN
ncbi:hypothetical protein O181_048298 [Austropuccinia psidii MF-1]|uniref:Retrovirus-related Pol polyprotein from transposon TNT 1-94-like beta-barrel domain-containing protein n=1 Tax=Austropuccinia psidii MF-1 TaxID=1389203 RepID=A0A9Q3HKD1_9BASI|nr:hypothetical protein [Austropuccinia psidii MF-1]